MNPHRVTTQAEFEASLRAQGFEKTDAKTATGTFWKSTRTGKHILVPDPYEGMYPDFILKDFRDQLSKLETRTLH